MITAFLAWVGLLLSPFIAIGFVLIMGHFISKACKADCEKVIA